MTEEEKRKIKNFEAKVRSLILTYKDMELELEKLQSDIAERDCIIQQLQTELGQCKKDYSNLKTAKMIELSDKDIKEAQNRITRLVREVNKCIGLLSSDKEDSYDDLWQKD